MSTLKISRTSLLVLPLAIVVFSSPRLEGAAAITSLNTSVVYDFESFTGSGFSPNPSAGQLDSDNWSVSGLSDGTSDGFGLTRTTGDFARGNSAGGVTTGGVYAFNTGGNITLGVQPGGSDFTPGSFTLRLRNLSGATATGLSIAYDIFVYNDESRANSFNFSYGVGSSASGPSSFAGVTSLDFTSAEAAAGSPSWVSIARSVNITDLSIAPDDYIFLRWTGDDVSGGGARDEFALDNLSVTAIPETSTTVVGILIAAGLLRRRRVEHQ